MTEDRAVRGVFGRVRRRGGLDVVVAAGSEEGLHVLSDDPIIVLLDLNEPRVNRRALGRAQQADVRSAAAFARPKLTTFTTHAGVVLILPILNPEG